MKPPLILASLVSLQSRTGSCTPTAAEAAGSTRCTPGIPAIAGAAAGRSTADTASVVVAAQIRRGSAAPDGHTHRRRSSPAAAAAGTGMALAVERTAPVLAGLRNGTLAEMGELRMLDHAAHTCR